jgi:cytochrome c-type biogenesis protein CcmH/NrfG
MKQIWLVIFLVIVGACSDNDNATGRRDLIPQPFNLAEVKDSRLLQAVLAAQAAVKANRESATAWGQLGHIYMAHEWETKRPPTESRWV